jgi:hypothetical protein
MNGHNHNTLYYTETTSNITFFWTSFMGSGSGMDADLLDGHHASEVIATGLPTGAIMWWNSTSGTVPSGWRVCDGSSGTPDARGLFICGAGSTYGLGGTTGSGSVTPAVSSITIGDTTITEAMLPVHSHSYTEYYAIPITPAPSAGYYSATYPYGGNAATSYTRSVTTSTDGGTGGSHTHSSGASVTYNAEYNVPPYYALYLIQKYT